jgi:acetyl-CoA carboxylase carboxyltransferase component
MTWQPELDELRRREHLAQRMGGPEKVARHHAQGRLTVRERIAALLDAETFHEAGALAGTAEYSAGGDDGAGQLTAFQPANFVCGTGRIAGRKVVVGGDDFTVRGGAADAAIVGKQVYAEQLANALRLPLVRLIDGTGGGGSVKLLERHGYTYVPANPGWDLVVENLSVVPVVAACLGSVAGLGAARLVAAHFAVMVAGTSQLFVAGPPLVKFGTGEDLSKEELGGVEIHQQSGAVDAIAASEEEAFALIRRFLSYLPQSVFQLPPVLSAADPPSRREEALLSAIPRDRRRPYRIRPILAAIFDADSVFELARYGQATVTALARLDGHPVGVVAADPYTGGGGLTVEGADAMTRLVDLCQTFHLPIVTLTDQPGLVIGREAERCGTLRHGVRAIAAVYQATVPAAEIIIRRVFGVGGAGITNRHRFVQRWAWPSADWGSLPIEGGIEAAYRQELEASDDPAGLLEAIRSRLDAVRSPFRTAERFGIEEIIDPRQTRPLLCEWVRDAYALLPEQLGRSAHGMRP